MTNKVWFVYIVRCEDGTLYTGVTNNIVRRIRQHNGEIKGGAKYTSGRRPVVLQAVFPVPTRSDALITEHKIKKMTKAQKLERIEQIKSLAHRM